MWQASHHMIDFIEGIYVCVELPAYMWSSYWLICLSGLATLLKVNFSFSVLSFQFDSLLFGDSMRQMITGTKDFFVYRFFFPKLFSNHFFLFIKEQLSKLSVKFFNSSTPIGSVNFIAHISESLMIFSSTVI